jgi:hypothetical protein
VAIEINLSAGSRRFDEMVAPPLTLKGTASNPLACFKNQFIIDFGMLWEQYLDMTAILQISPSFPVPGNLSHRGFETNNQLSV